MLTYSQFCKTSKNLQPAKQGLFSLIPKTAVHIDFAVNLARFFRTSIQKQQSRGALKRRCSENMQQIYRRTPMLKCDFNKIAKQLY